MKHAVVIGASSGVGAHIAGRLADHGWSVTGTGRRPRQDTPLADGIDYVRADLADERTAETLSGLLADRGPGLIVYNAATYGSIGRDRPPTVTQLDEVFRVNATMPYQVLLQHLTRDEPGTFCSYVMVNSDSIYHANETQGVYAASKAALRVLTTALAAACRTREASVSTLLLGPLADQRKLDELREIARRRESSLEQITRAYLRRSNTSYVTDSLIDLESCFRSVEYIAGLGKAANGMLCRLDGGSAGSLI